MPTAVEEVCTTSDGARLRVLDEGPRDAPVTVVFTHGWTLSQRSWDGVVDGLPVAAGTEVRTVRFDFRGHGDSDPAEDGVASIDRCADDLAELIDQRVPHGRIVLAGHSMGGMTIMALAERHPHLLDRVAGVAFVGTSAGDLAAPALGLPAGPAALANRGERAFRKRLATARGRRLVKRSALLRPGMRWLLFGRRPQSEHVAATAEWLGAVHPANMAAYRESLAVHERAGVLGKFADLPVVVLAGTADRLTPFAHAQRISEQLPGARLLVYAGAGHMLPLERSGAVTDRIAELVRGAR
ncbi:alpha/beta fold hydrolase [Saccharopolyspora montiporae]|uniref:alpha/beta fold hydrolase n=1 Tax=Saccharopolyspora montiporae TaxID=2781240 RepID=UPI001D132DE7|nr:alpha/beta hydrolase [Saccharopolyspora sp. HNM0983]